MSVRRLFMLQLRIKRSNKNDLKELNGTKAREKARSTEETVRSHLNRLSRISNSLKSGAPSRFETTKSILIQET